MKIETQRAGGSNVSAEFARRRRRMLMVGWGSFVLLIPLYVAYCYSDRANVDLIFWLAMVASLPIALYQIAIWRCPNCRHFLSRAFGSYMIDKCPRCRASFKPDDSVNQEAAG